MVMIILVEALSAIEVLEVRTLEVLAIAFQSRAGAVVVTVFMKSIFSQEQCGVSLSVMP